MSENPQTPGHDAEETAPETSGTEVQETAASAAETPVAPETPAVEPPAAEVPAPAAPVAETPVAPFTPPVVAPVAAPAPAASVPPPFVPPSGAPTQPVPPAFAPAQPVAAPAEPRKRSLAVPLIATAVVAALLGGGAGAGVAVWAITAQSGEASTETASGNQTITVNNPDSIDAVTAVAAKAAPSVVTIAVSSNAGSGTGSGVILSDDGYVLTNTHVVTLDGESADGGIEVTTADGRIYSATVVGLDPVVDLAVLKLDDATDLTPIEFGDVDSLDVGDMVVAIGAPLGLANTVTDGIVSALDRSIQIASSAVPDSGQDDENEDQGGQSPFDFWNYGQGGGSGSTSTISIPVIQTDAAINPGNSGGALVDAEGKLVGINVAIASTGGSSTDQSGSIGVGFSIPSDLAQRVAQEIIDNGEATHGLLGASVSTATSSDSAVVGAVIQEVVPGGAAAAAGLEAGDIVTSFAGHPITSSVDLTAQVRALAAGATAELVFQRGGDEQTVDVTLGELSL